VREPELPAPGTQVTPLVDISKRIADADGHDRRQARNAEHGRWPHAAPQTAELVARVDRHLVSLVAPDSIDAEQYRGLRYVVEHLQKQGEPSGTLVGVCSPLSGDGKSLTALNLAGSLAQDPDARVLLIEVDLRRPSVTIGNHLTLRRPRAQGLVDAILDPSLTLDQVIQYLPAFNLGVLPAGRCASSPYEALKSPRFVELLALARRRFDYVILDAPPVVPVPDCRLIAKLVDGFIMVVAARRTPRVALEESLNLLGPEKIVGLVFNGIDRSSSRHYGYGYGYGYGHPNPRSWWSRLLGR
jgi:capsular exopolysaccharide synthesis family protein